MTLQELKTKIAPLIGIKFGDLYNTERLETILLNKGQAGQMLELTSGLMLSSNQLDCEDGELKTNKVQANGKPKETVFITQISKEIDNLLSIQPFQESYIYKKISNLLYVPICKEGHQSNWYIMPYIHVSMENHQFSIVYEQLEKDYYTICNGLNEHITTSSDGYIHTTNGKFIQVRSKDSKRANGQYNPIYSNKYGRYISNKNHAFYFKKEFVFTIRKIAFGEKWL
ncbi:DNA mismatch repair protein MutH [Clostridium sp. SYSU_GA19001]|uniref:MutH/Sau3AI family endonuclease n=1 Tax=Clostridium caldaquaticum TaxID=2940653 RepID=UPI0020772FE8|nr:MutH/Sau3AI family endonuclease [Clostridium caldaquaticum]MCM8710129.1 DNA mismatch repair protein MutH [Clostridium caldaquaticum]